MSSSGRPAAGRSFDDWYAANFTRLAASMIVAAGNRHDGEDAAAEAFARAYARWGRVGRMDAPEAWVYRVAVNILRRAGRRRQLESLLVRRLGQELPRAAPPPGVDDGLWAAVRALPERMRTAIGLRYCAGFTQAEIAEAMRVAPGTVAAHLHAGRRHLAKSLQELEIEGGGE